MMIDYELLFEFEELLALTSVHKTVIILENLELKVDRLRCDEQLHQHTFNKEDLTEVFEAYLFTEDEFVTCPKCGQGLMDEAKYKQCCKNYIYNNSQITSHVETSYWLAFMNNPVTTISTLPYYTQLLCLQQGIPNQLRSLVWEKLFLLDHTHLPELSRLVFENLQHSYNTDISKQIAKDLNRTFPLTKFFKEPTTIKNLDLILNVYANFDSELGYCQGLLFLVGVLYYHFNLDCQMTFHALICIMDIEPQLRNIFTTNTMLDTLSRWEREFTDIVRSVDPELADHLFNLVEPQAFLYQWWMSFMLSHLPDLLIVNRIMDFCMIQGWKIGLLKISLGLILSNKPILMAVGRGDEEVIYQHLLNELKWGNVINNLDLFFGDLLLLWDDDMFVATLEHPDKELQRALTVELADLAELTDTPQALMMEKVLSLIAPSYALAPSDLPELLRERAGLDISDTMTSQLSASVFSKNLAQPKNEMESIYSDLSELSENYKLFTDYLRLPLYALRKLASPSEYAGYSTNIVAAENEGLKQLLRSAQQLLDDSNPQAAALKEEIGRVLG
ncbi:TBC domain-containing protein [Kocuria palustris]|nr:TBC domain-containing protein [Kocuria palustris]